MHLLAHVILTKPLWIRYYYFYPTLQRKEEAYEGWGLVIMILSLSYGVYRRQKRLTGRVCFKFYRRAIPIVWQIMYKIPCSTSPCLTYLNYSPFSSLLFILFSPFTLIDIWKCSLIFPSPWGKKIMFFWWYRYYTVSIVIYIYLISHWEQQRKGIMPFSFLCSLLLPPNPGAWNMPYALGMW